MRRLTLTRVRLCRCSCEQIEFGGTCHISGRPYTVFRWRPGNDARYKKTIICQEVAKAKNVCQVRE
jgi:pre-mRNA-splicing factor RBM22/SLT11